MDFEKLTVKKELQGIEVQFDEPLKLHQYLYGRSS